MGQDIQKMIQTMTEQLPCIRKKYGLSQHEFGEKIGVSRQTVSSIERGEYTMPWDIFLAVTYFVKINEGVIKPENMTQADEFLLVTPKHYSAN
jgi:DNA-binding XRE family transcriptional regulator